MDQALHDFMTTGVIGRGDPINAESTLASMLDHVPVDRLRSLIASAHATTQPFLDHGLNGQQYWLPRERAIAMMETALAQKASA